MRICLKIIVLISLIFVSCYDKNNYIKNAKVRLKHKDFLGCIEECNKAIRVEPTFAPSYFYKAIAYKNMKNYTEAIVNCYIALDLDSTSSNSYNLRGELKYEQAIESCHYPECKDPRKYYYISIVSKEAIIDYTKAIKLDPKNSNAYCNRATAKEKIGDYNGALVDCKKALELDSSHAEIYLTMGIVKYKLGDKDGASTDYKKHWQLREQYVGSKIKDTTN